MSTLLAKARKSTRNMVTNRHSSRESARESLHPSSTDEEEIGGAAVESNTTETTESDADWVPEPSKKRTRSGRTEITKRLSSREIMARRKSTQEDYQLDPWDEDNLDAFPPELHHKQSCAPLSSLFCLAQTIILSAMMIQCGVAPMNINPMIGPYPDALNYWGAKNSVLIIEDGEAWRLITPIFLHAGLIHLMGNVMVQIESGNRWEKEWGSIIWIIIYIGSALFSSILSAIVMPDQISVGSSGAVMGLFGGKFAEIILLCCERSETRVEKADERSRKEQACEVIGGIILVMAMSFIPYVDWAAHLGGLIAGFMIGLVCFSFKIRNWFFIAIWLVIGVGGTIALFSGALAYLYTQVEANDELRDVCGYYKQFFAEYECQCMLDEAIQFGSWQFGGGANNGGGGDGGDKLM